MLTIPRNEIHPETWSPKAMKPKKQGQLSLTLWTLLVGLVAIGCGSKKSGSTVPSGTAKSSGDVTRELNCTGDKTTKAEDAEELALIADDEGNVEPRRVPAEDLIVQEGKASISLCNMMRANPDSQLAMFFFTRASCFKCSSWIQKVAAGMEPYGNKILPVAIVSESPSILSDADMDALKGEVAPEFVWVRDPDGEVWDFFAPDQGASNRMIPMVIEMDGGARGFALEDTGLEAKDLIDQATKVLGLDLGEGT
jgi:hypothetical protein